MARTTVRAHEVCPPIRHAHACVTTRHGLRRSHHLCGRCAQTRCSSDAASGTITSAAAPAPLQCGSALCFFRSVSVVVNVSRGPAKCALCAVRTGLDARVNVLSRLWAFRAVLGVHMDHPQPSVAIARVCMVGHVARGCPMLGHRPECWEV